MKKRAAATLLAGVAAAMLLGSSPFAQASPYPEKPVRLIVPFTPGGATDLVARILQKSVGETLGQPVVIEYKAGAGGSIGMQAAAHAQPDGYTIILAATNNLVVDQFFNKSLQFDPLRQLLPIIKVAEVPAVLFTNAQSQAPDWATLVSKYQGADTPLFFGSVGIGTTTHLSSVLLAKHAGISITHVSYRGAQPAATALMANEVQLFMGAIGQLDGQVRAGRLVPLGVSASKRLGQYPDIPTLQESGIPPVLANNYFVIATPADTPADRVQRLSDAFNAAIHDEKNQRQLESNGILASGLRGPELLEQLKREAAKWSSLIKTENIKDRE